MAVKLKKVKEQPAEKRVFFMANLNPFIMALNKLLMPTRGDEKRLDAVDQTLQHIAEEHQRVVQQFFKEHQLPEDEQIDETHPLYKKWLDFYLKEVKEPTFPEFTEQQFAAVTTGAVLTFQEKKLLKFWLLKQD